MIRLLWFLTVFFFFAVPVFADDQFLALDNASRTQKADRMENQAVAAVDAGQMEKGLSLMRQAIALDAAPSRELNYGSILFGNGVSLFKSGQKDKGKKILADAREQLLKAADGFDKTKEVLFLGQAYFLLGEIERNGFADAAKAKEYYKKALSFYDHEGAKAALAQLGG
jgi:tetratricopeptide (TPR) repeat protein